MSLLRRLVALILACIVPPAGGFLVRGLRLGVWINLALFLVAQGVFWLVAAAPGLAIMGLAILHAIVLCLLPFPSQPKAVTT